MRGVLNLAVLLRHLVPDSHRALRGYLMRHVGDESHNSMVFSQVLSSLCQDYEFLAWGG